MKVIKALIEIRHPDSTSTEYVGYPKVWMDNRERISAVLIPQDRDEEIARDGKLYKILYPVIPDDLAEVFLKLPDFSVADPVELQAYSDKHWPKRQVIDRDITDPILFKMAKGEALTQKDKDALDSKHPEKGVVMTKDFVELAKEYGADNI